MRRSLRLVAAVCWLLELGACAAEDLPPRSPAAGVHPAIRPEISRTGRGDDNARARPLAPAPHLPAAAPTPALASRPSHRHLRDRFAHARPLSVLHGSASYYAEKFDGRRTASGALYESRGYTAAHRSLPFGTVLRVTRVDGGQVVYVRVTDRGPFGPRGRILDLSRAAAEELQMLRAGVVKIRAEVVEYGPPRKKRRRRR